MPKTKQNSTHKQRLQKFKIKQKQNMTENKTPSVPQMPPIRNIPVWEKNAKIELLGYEWEVIYNTVAQMQLLGQATNAVMSRNIVNGVIKMDFEKLNPETLEYDPMSEDEKKPFLEEFQNTIQAIKDRENSIPVKSTEEPTLNVVAEAPEVKTKKTRAKVVKM